MDFQKLMENKPVFYGIIVGATVILLIIIIAVFSLAFGAGKKGADGLDAKKSPVLKENVTLVSTDKPGVAIEVQALLARYGIKTRRAADGSKTAIVLSKDDKITEEQKDQAIVKIVESGLVEEHTGLEIFDKGDFTSTKEDKRIRLIRAMNGELARLIRKIPPIKNAQVFVSVPEQSLFSSQQKPITATVQVQLDTGDRLDAMKVKAITNLLLVQFKA